MVQVLRGEGLGVAFGGLRAVDDVTLGVGEWEIVGVIGPNGAGKTTTFDLLTGLRRPDTGRVLLRGRDVTRLPVHRRAALGVARTFQNLGLVHGETVLANVLTAQHLRARYSAVAGLVGAPGVAETESGLVARSRRVLELLGLDDVAGTDVDELPYGLAKRVEVAAALASGADLLLLDEPASGLGPTEATELGHRLQALRDDLGLSILMIEHHVPLVTAVCDYVYCLDAGRLLAEGEPEAVRADPAVAEAYLGRAA